MKREWKNKKGLTLIEILMVLVLLSTVIGYIATNVFKQVDKGNVQATKIAISQLSGALDNFRIDCQRYPSEGEGLQILLKNQAAPDDCPAYDDGGYVKNETQLKDAWKKPFLYQNPNATEYEIISLGADNKKGGEKKNADISSEDG